MIAAALPDSLLRRFVPQPYLRYQWNVLISSSLIAAVVWLGLPHWGFCLFETSLGVAGPCCGATTAMSGLLHGQWHVAAMNLAAAGMAVVLIAQIPLRTASLLDRPRRIYGPKIASQFNLLLVAGMLISWLV